MVTRSCGWSAVGCVVNSWNAVIRVKLFGLSGASLGVLLHGHYDSKLWLGRVNFCMEESESLSFMKLIGI